MKKLFTRRAGKHERGGGAITALIVAFFIALNLMLVAVNATAQWFFSITDKQYYTLNGSTDEYFKSINPEESPVILYFCMSEDGLNENYTYGRILDTVKQFSDRYDFFSHDFLDVYYDYDFIKNELGVDLDVKRAAEETPPREVEEPEITNNSVIVYSPGVGHVVRALSTFYIFDTSENATSDEMIFNGEELVATLVYRVLGTSFPKAYFTTGHGESSTQSMQGLLFSAGYDVWTADLSKNDVGDDCSLVVIANPLYDFEEFQSVGGERIESEITRLQDFIARGGTVLVLRSPFAPALPRLDAFCEAYGLSVSVGSILRDAKSSIASNDSVLLLGYADSTVASTVKDRAAKAEGVGDLAAAGVTALSLKDGNGFSTAPLLKTSEGAVLYTEGKVASEGEHTVAAISRIDGKNGQTGSLVLLGTVGLGDAALLDMGSYGNESFLYSLLEYTGGIQAPIGAGVVVLNTYPLTDLSARSAKLLFALFTFVIPLSAAVAGFAVCRTRKNR